MVNFIFEEKQNGKYVETFRCDDEQRVYDFLAHELIAKKLESCQYIRSIKRKQLYTGFIQIIVSYINGDRRTYTVKAN